MGHVHTRGIMGNGDIMSAALLSAMLYWTAPQKNKVEYTTRKAIYKQFGGESFYGGLKKWGKDNVSEEVGLAAMAGASAATGRIKIKHENILLEWNTKKEQGSINFKWGF